MIVNLIGAWMMAVTWSIMIRKVLGYNPDHVLNWGGAFVAFVGFLLLSELFSDIN